MKTTATMKLLKMHQANKQTSSKRRNRPYIKLGLFLFLLTGCATHAHKESAQGVLNPVSEQIGYKRSLQIITDDQHLKSAFKKALLKEATFFAPMPENSFSEFRLIVSSRISRVQSLETKPKLFGYIQKDSTPVDVVYTYALEKNTGHTLTNGTLNIITEAKTSIYPQLKRTTEVSSDELEKMVKTIIKDAKKSAQSTPWSSEVIAQKDTKHIVMSGSEDLGLNIGDLFITKTQPTSKLEIVLFEKNVAGLKQPILRLISGPLPTTGKSLAPVVKGEKIQTGVQMPYLKQ